MLSDRKILELISSGKLIIDPLRDDTIQQNGVDLRIGWEIGFQMDKSEIIDLADQNVERFFTIEKIKKDGILIEPKTSFLLHTEEYISLPSNIAALCELRSTLARFGFIAPPTVIDAGFKGQLTIEVFWGGSSPVRIYPGIRFLHVIFFEIPDGVMFPYSGSYQNQRGIRLPKSLRSELEND
ncbi:TPA: dCTP deaminase [Candidatus Bathyarchaeota archaeon]|nr:dCTP deaminase [Candidatus Bathyarchaeota archaeon]